MGARRVSSNTNLLLALMASPYTECQQALRADLAPASHHVDSCTHNGVDVQVVERVEP